MINLGWCVYSFFFTMLQQHYLNMQRYISSILPPLLSTSCPSCIGYDFAMWHENRSILKIPSWENLSLPSQELTRSKIFAHHYSLIHCSAALIFLSLERCHRTRTATWRRNDYNSLASKHLNNTTSSSNNNAASTLQPKTNQSQSNRQQKIMSNLHRNSINIIPPLLNCIIMCINLHITLPLE